MSNGTLFNSEAWQGISNADVEQLEKADEALIRGLFRAQAKVPLRDDEMTPLKYYIESPSKSQRNEIRPVL